jgi:F0F1-type ATP synthase membrane subunit b/b'
MKNLEETIESALENIQEDRAVTKELLQDLMKYLAAAEERHREVGSTAAKYVETLQRSNEQLVKIAALMQKNKTTTFEFSTDDKNSLYDLINQEDDG